MIAYTNQMEAANNLCHYIIDQHSPDITMYMSSHYGDNLLLTEAQLVHNMSMIGDIYAK